VAGADGPIGADGGAGVSGGPEQPASAASSASQAGLALPDQVSAADRDNRGMWLILLEALGALLVLIGIVWWTMFSGRRGGERAAEDDPGP
jgi:hypothetical protein